MDLGTKVPVTHRSDHQTMDMPKYTVKIALRTVKKMSVVGIELLKSASVHVGGLSPLFSATLVE